MFERWKQEISTPLRTVTRDIKILKQGRPHPTRNSRDYATYPQVSNLKLKIEKSNA